jgi:uncharacterized membrane protein
VQTQTIQLDNVKIVSISGTGLPATIAVVQEQIAPCYSYLNGGAAKQVSICPMGVSDFSANAATQNVTAPQAMMPNWAMLRKYVVTVDAQTVLLDKNRTALTLANLKVGDQLNVYGETSDSQTVNADIVRDLSLPPAASKYTGKVTQVNTDDSFIIQTNDGQTVTVQSPIQVGATVTVRGVLNPASNILSQTSAIYLGSAVTTPPIIYRWNLVYVDPRSAVLVDDKRKPERVLRYIRDNPLLHERFG